MTGKGLVFLAMTVVLLWTSISSGQSGIESVLSPKLRKAAQERSTEPIAVSVMVTGDPDLGNLVQDPRRMTVGGFTWIRGKVQGRNLTKLASIRGVTAVLDNGSRKPPLPPDPDLPRRSRLKSDLRLKALKAAPDYSPDSLKVGPMPKGKVQKGWFLKDILGLEQAWNHGYRGEGVKVAVMDTGIDFAHPDLYGKQARVENPSSPYHGWPICFDSLSMDTYFSTGSTKDTWYVDTTTTPPVTIHGATATANLSLSNGGPPQTRTVTFKTESVSGIYHFGVHPDNSMKEVLNGVFPFVLLVDHPDTAVRGPGYNTVYVDLDGDLDFTDEKPCFRGDEISFRDVWDSQANAAGTDGYPDVSGGMIYFIADGTKPIPASDWLYNASAPPAASLVAFMINDYLGEGENHGTLCASAVAGGGVINGNAPPYKPSYSGVGSGMVVGPAPQAGIIAVGNFYQGGYFSDFQFFCALGYDGKEETGDEPNVVSMSFGSGSVDDDGWDWESRFIESVHLHLAPDTTWCNSTGNGAPGYGTVNTPGPPSGIAVGACTGYDTCDSFDSINSPDQILAGDVQGWSCAGPQADGRQGVSVMAHGAWGSGDIPLNEAGDGWTAWESWGGTSRACPEAAGITALIYQAYRAVHGSWPSASTARQFLMNSAVDLQSDVFRQGAGRVHAGRAVELASDLAGIAVTPESWIPGDFRGEIFNAYAHIVQPGDVHQQEFTVHNVSASPAILDVSSISLVAVNQLEFDIHTIANTAEAYDFRRPSYLYELQGPNANSIPEDTDFMVIEAIFPFEVFDTNFTPGNAASVTPSYENRYRLLVYDWTDKDGDGKLYDESIGTTPGVIEPAEIDQWEYMRFNYGYNSGTSMKVFVSDPLGKMHDGIFVGIQHNTGSPIATTVRIRTTFYRESECSWMELDKPSLTIPPDATATLKATVTIPGDMPVGSYSAKIILQDSSVKSTEKTSTGGIPGRTVVPVSINVAAALNTGSIVIPGTHTGNEPYDNSAVHGDFSWRGQDESGDGRLFFLDVPSPSKGDYLFTHTVWEDAIPTDLDTLILGPVMDTFTYPGSSFYHPSFGPNTLAWIGGYRSPGRPNWTFKTLTGTTSDYSTASLTDGLHALFVHNILFSGQRFAVPFSIETGKINLDPAPPQVYTTSSNMIYDITLTSSLQIDGFQASAYGPSKVQQWYDDQSILQNWSYWYQLPVNDCGLLQVDLQGTARDIDLYLYRDGADGSNPDGQFTDDEIIASSLSSTSNEQIALIFPPDGFYRALAYGYSVTSLTDTFDMTGRIISGHGVTFSGSSQGTVFPGNPRRIEMQAALNGGHGQYDLFLCMGPSSANQAISIRVPVTYYVPGDANEDGIVTIDDFYAFPLHWLSWQDVPVGIDYDHDGKLDQGDLLDFLRH